MLSTKNDRSEICTAKRLRSILNGLRKQKIVLCTDLTILRDLSYEGVDIKKERLSGGGRGEPWICNI